MNTNYKNYPRKADIDAHGIDLVDYKGKVKENIGSYTMARYATYKVGKENAAKVQAHAQTRRDYDRIKTENDFKMRQYQDRMDLRDRIAAHNEAHPENPMPMPSMPKYPKLKELPELKKQGRLAAIPMLRWFMPGKAPVADTATA